MKPLAGSTRSLTARLLIGVGLPMIILAVALGLGGGLMIRATVTAVNDRILEAAARGIADSLTIEEGEIALDLSPAIFGMLENTARDNVYYTIRYRGRALTGYGDLPQISLAPGEDAAAFGDARYLDRDIRIVARARRLPGLDAPVVIEVAETLDARKADTNRLLSGLLFLESALILVAVLLLPFAVRWGLRPVARIQAELDHRVAADLAPLSLDAVPAELRNLVKAFNAMLGRLGDAMIAMRRFTGDASHQIRTPLSIIRTHVAVLRSAAPGSTEAAQSLDDIDRGTVRLSHLVGQLLALARADNAARNETPLEAVDLRDIVTAVVAERREASARAGVTLVVVPAPAIIIRTAPVLALELLANLLDNAVRHGGAGGIVRVTATEDPALLIDDDGPGIPATERERVFTRFAQLPRDARNEGSGLGLSIARSLAQAIGAELRLEDGPDGRGLRAIVHFPRP